LVFEEKKMANFIYVTAPSGLRMRIALTGDPVDRKKIGEKLVAAGVPLDEVIRSGYSLVKPNGPKSYTAEERLAIVNNKGGMPPFPEPDANNFFPEFSQIRLSDDPPVSLQQRFEDEKRGFFMQKGNAEFVDVMSLPKGEFVNGSDYDLMHSGRVALASGKVWRKIDQQNVVDQSVEYERTSAYKYGVTEATKIEIEATLGYEGYGASVSLRFLFSREITISSEETNTESYKVKGQNGKVVIFGVFQECDILVLLKDGVRQNNPIFSLMLKDKDGNPYRVLDRFDGTLIPQELQQAHTVIKKLSGAIEASGSQDGDSKLLPYC
jgi:hypothetical protein